MTNNPFDEDDGIEYLKDKIDVFCPYCGVINRSSVEDYYTGTPPMQDRLFISWICDDCCRDFKTEEGLDEEGMLNDYP